MARHQQDRRIGDHLVDRGLVGKTTLDAAARVAQESGAYIGEVLVSIGAIDSESLTRALADLWEIPYAVPGRTAAGRAPPGRGGCAGGARPGPCRTR